MVRPVGSGVGNSPVGFHTKGAGEAFFFFLNGLWKLISLNSGDDLHISLCLPLM